MSTRRNFQSNRQTQNKVTTHSNMTNTPTEGDDVINITTDQAQDFWLKNQKNIMIGLALILLFAGLYLAYKHLYKGPQEEEAVTAMYKAEELFAQDSFAAALKNPGANFEGFESIADNYGSTKAGNTAKLYAGICNLNLGKYEDAISYLEDYSADDDVTPAVKYGALGDAYAETNQLDKAYDFYSKAAKASDDEFSAPFYMNKLGLLQFAQKKNDEALATFKTIFEKYPNTQEGREAEKFIARLEK